MLKLTYLGHSAFLLTDTQHHLLFDPFLTGNPLAPVQAEAIKADYVLLTHGHGDHSADAIAIAKRHSATLIAPYELAIYCQKKGCKVHPMGIGGAHVFDFGRVKLTIAHHGSGIDLGGETLAYVGSPCGYLVTLAGKTIYHAGDTGLFSDMKLIGEMNRIDVALLPIGDNYTMGIDDAVKAVELLNPGLAIPMHFNTFSVIESDPQEFVDKVKAQGQQARYLLIGEEILL
ncbi:MAG TPA: metal-dependent hydrolase [bacterium]|jgi:L-ascorbate metabolism protein UlaG (beta-lactamase superfamily)|nr:metal-dependent hydrolase [bacterium]HNT64503.1 metal-dependent hydrolase [bacterium]HOX84652.1 metal-dependent hydrolase [bacterium]HPG45375.1 metal-dependent hydrolase [bacterium]HPM96849.1 metal-dependent hydrolase [bacterium]